MIGDGGLFEKTRDNQPERIAPESNHNSYSGVNDAVFDFTIGLASIHTQGDPLLKNKSTGTEHSV